MKTLLIISALFILVTTGYSQYYDKHYGVRMGNTFGINAKVLKGDKLALEGMLGFRQRGMQIYGFIESYQTAFSKKTDNMKLYFGPGAHLGFTTISAGYYKDNPYYYAPPDWAFYPVIGIDGIIGLEYWFPMAPVVLGVDFKPYFELESFYRPRFVFWDFGFCIRYVL